MIMSSIYTPTMFMRPCQFDCSYQPAVFFSLLSCSPTYAVPFWIEVYTGMDGILPPLTACRTVLFGCTAYGLGCRCTGLGILIRSSIHTISCMEVSPPDLHGSEESALLWNKIARVCCEKQASMSHS